MSIRTCAEVERAASTTERSLEALYHCSIISRTRLCNSCGQNMRLVQSVNKKYTNNGGWVYRCGNCYPKKYKPLRADTVLSYSKKPLGDYIRLIWAFAVGNLRVCLHLSVKCLMQAMLQQRLFNAQSLSNRCSITAQASTSDYNDSNGTKND